MDGESHTGSDPADDARQRELATRLAATEGVASRSDLTSWGYTTQTIERLLRHRLLRRVAHGAYVEAATYAKAGRQEQHRLRTLALLRSRPALAASRLSAAVVWKLPVAPAGLGRVHLSRPGGSATHKRAGYTVHGGFVVPATVVEVHGVRVECLAVAVIWVAIMQGVTSGVAVADWALHRGMTTQDELADWLERMRRVPYLAMARRAVQLADGRSESPGESRLRMVLLALGYVVEPQWRVHTSNGAVIAVVDFYLPELGVVVEFDGAVKYTRGRAEDGALVVFAEKQREDRIRRLGYGVVRVVWADLDHPDGIRHAIAAAAQVATVR